MKAIRVSEFGEPDVLKYVDVAEPVPGAGEVRVRLYAAGVNPSDVYTRTGTYVFNRPELPYTPGSDGAGVVDAIGEDVNQFSVGDRVYVCALFAKRYTGTYAQKVVCDAEAIYRLTDDITFEQGASLGVPALTAVRALYQRAGVQPGETVLVHGASGGVGLLTVQMAKAMGAIVIGTAGSAEGKSLVKAAGASHVFDHITADTIDQVLSVTKGKGPDVIIEMLANVNLETDLKMAAKFGRIVIVGSRGSLEFNPRLAMIKEADILGMAVFNMTPDEYKRGRSGVHMLLGTKMIRPEVGVSIPLENAAAAHTQIMSNKAHGKMVLSIE